MRILSFLLNITLSFSLFLNPLYAVNEKVLAELLNDSAKLFPHTKVRFKRILPEDHPIVTTKKLPLADRAALRLEEAKKEGQRPEVAFLALQDAVRIYGKTLKPMSEFEEALASVKVVLQKGGEIEINEQKVQVTSTQLSGIFEKFYPALESVMSKQILSPFHDLVEDWKTVEKLDIRAAALSERLENLYGAFTALAQPLRAQAIESHNRLFDSYVEMPKFAPRNDVNLLIKAIDFGQTLLILTQGERRLQVLGALEKAHTDLNERLKLDGNQSGDRMAALLSRWSFQTLGQKVKKGWPTRDLDHDYLPKPLPLVGLEYSWAGLCKEQIEADQGRARETVKQYYGHILKAVDYLAADQPRDNKAYFVTITKGISRSLAIEMLKDAYATLMKYEEMGYGTAEDFATWKKAIADKACALVEDMEFSACLGIVGKYYQAVAFNMVSAFFDNPLKKYIYQQLANSKYTKESDTHNTNIASYFGNGEAGARIINYGREKKVFENQASQHKQAAFEEAVGLAEGFRKEAVGAEGQLTKLIALAKAEAMVGIASHIGEVTELKAMIVKDNDTELDAFMKTTTQEFEAKLPKETDDPVTFIAKYKEARASTRSFSRILGHLNNAFGIMDQYSPWRLKWDVKQNPKVAELSKTCGDQENKLDPIFRQFVDKWFATYKARFEKGENSESLSAEFEKDLLQLSEFEKEDFIWGKMGFVLKLRMAEKRKALELAKSPSDVIRIHREMCDSLSRQRTLFPPVLPTLEELSRTEKDKFFETRLSHMTDQLYKKNGWKKDGNDFIPISWLQELNEQRSFIDRHVLKFLDGFTGSLRELSVPECQRHLREVIAIVEFMAQALDEKNPYNTLSQEKSMNDYGWEHGRKEFQKRYSQQAIDNYKKLLTFIETLERQDIGLREIEQLLVVPDQLGTNEFSALGSRSVLRKKVADKYVAQLKTLPSDAFFKEVRCLSEVTCEKLGRPLTALVEETVYNLLTQKIEDLEAKFIQLREEPTLDKKKELLAELTKCVAEYETERKKYTSPSASWGTGQSSVCVGHVRSPYSNPIANKTFSPALATLRHEIETYGARDEARRLAAELKSKVEVSQRMYEELRAEANRVKEVAKNDKEKFERYTEVLDKVQDLYITVMGYENNSFDEVTKQLKTLTERLEIVVRQFKPKEQPARGKKLAK